MHCDAVTRTTTALGRVAPLAQWETPRGRTKKGDFCEEPMLGLAWLTRERANCYLMRKWFRSTLTVALQV